MESLKVDRRRVGSTRGLCAMFLVLSVLLVVLLVCLLKLPKQEIIIHTEFKDCPDKIAPESFTKFPEGLTDILLGEGKKFLLDKSVDVNTIQITDGASLVLADTGNPIKIRTKYIKIMNSGSLIIGSEGCPYRSDLDISLFGRADDPQVDASFGRKFIGVTSTGSIDIHGPWRLSWTHLAATIQPGTDDVIIELQDNAVSWNAGDEIVIASSSYDMNQAERFKVIDCPSCSNNQIKIKGPVKYKHIGQVTKGGVDVRAEVGLLTRNIKIHGEMESSCYRNCEFFDYDTFGGHTQVLVGAVKARFEGIELYNMGRQSLGKYPIHFHRVGYGYGMYARQLSIHDCFSRCVTLHAVQGVVVEDVVGYNTLGHCFFLEDGNEIENTLRHNLGLVTRAGTLLPSDRNDAMCKRLTTNPKVYLPNPEKECNGIATFWISHPNNTIVNNSAAGSEQVGFYNVFYREPILLSAGSLPPFHGERNPLSKFSGNRAHSNHKAGYYMNHGVKTTQPSDQDYRDFQAIIEEEKYAPHVDRNLSLPRVPALIESFTGYKNSLGLFARGGDVWVESARLADNDVNVILASSSSLPYDAGSHQQLLNSVIVGRSDENEEWKARSGPNVGIQIQDGPVLIGGNVFYSFIPTDERRSYAIGFLPNNPGISSPANVLSHNEFDQKSMRIYMGPTESGPDLDGDRTQNLFDAAGILTGVPGSYVIRADNPLLVTSRCQNTTQLQYVYNASIVFCPATHYGLLFVNSTNKNVTLRINDFTSGDSRRNMTFSGLPQDGEKGTHVQYQPVLLPNNRYRLTWIGDSAPDRIDLSVLEYNLGEYIDLEICYPPNTTFNVTRWVWDQTLDRRVSEDQLTAADTLSQLTDSNSSSKNDQLYHWNSSSRLLSLRLTTKWQTTNFAYCPKEGCQYVTVSANFYTQAYTECGGL